MNTSSRKSGCSVSACIHTSNFISAIKRLNLVTKDKNYISLESLKSLLLGGANRFFENTMVAELLMKV